MPKQLAQQFEKEFDLDADVIKQHFYKEPNPNAYLATFAEFLIKTKMKNFVKKYIREEMVSFVENYIMQFENCKEVPVHFVGSIAFYLKDELKAILSEYGIEIGNVLRRPIDGLIEFHVQNN